MKLNNTLYSILKWCCIIFLPATATLVLGLSTLYGWAWGETASKTIMLVDTFIGALIGVATCQYNENKQSEELDQEFDE